MIGSCSFRRGRSARPRGFALRARRGAGFTLTELAVVLAIVGLLLGGLLYTLSAQVEQRNREDTQRRLEEARELVIAFALARARLPCPASATSNGDESFASGNPAAGGTCSDSYSGFLPAKAIGFQPTDGSGYAMDAWGTRIRYAVSKTSASRFTKQHTAASPWSLNASPDDLVICAAWGNNPNSCGAAASVTNADVVVAVLWSQGKNFLSGTTGGPDELANHKAASPYDKGVFVSHPPAPVGASGGEFDDMLVWIPVGLLYSRMIAAGILP